MIPFSNIRGPPSIFSYWKVSLKTWHLLRVSSSLQHPQCSGLKRSRCQGALSLKAAKLNVATLLLYETGPQSLLFCPDALVLLLEVQWVPGASASMAQKTPVKHQCQPSGCRLLQIVFINTLLLRSCLKHRMPFPSPGFMSCHPFSATDLWEHRLDTPSLLRFFIFYNNGSVSSSLELQIPNCGTSKI